MRMTRPVLGSIAVLVMTAGAAMAETVLQDACDGSQTWMSERISLADDHDFRFPNQPARFHLAGIAEDRWAGRAAVMSGWAKNRALKAVAARGSKPDRYRRVPVMLYRSGDDIPLNALLLAKGNARLSGQNVPLACHRALIPHEDKARNDAAGLWADPDFAVLRAWDPDAMAEKIGSFQVVEGRILSTGRTDRRLYLNFGEYWAEDFTVEIGKRGEKILERAGMRLEDWAGARIRVRGWLTESRGPMILVESPNQIERLSD